MIQEQILIGTLLGDAYIGKLQNRSKSYNIKWEHSLKQKEYALWKAENSLNNYSVYERSRFDKRTNKIYNSIICYSRKDNYEYYRNLFYNTTKEVSQEVLELLQPMAIAVWFMDDGNLYYNGNNCHLTLSINGFSEESMNRIIEYFRLKYNILFKKIGKAIRLTSVKQVELFEGYFKQYYHDSMKYKTLQFKKEEYDRNMFIERKKYRNTKYK